MDTGSATVAKVRSVIVGLLAVPVALVHSDQQPQFRATTSLVRLEVAVTDERGAVQGLRPDDFEVVDNGSRQVVRIEETTDVPLDLVLVAQPIPSVAFTSARQAPLAAAGLSAFLDQVEERDRLAALVASAPPTRLRPLVFGRPDFGIEAFNSGDYAAPFDAIAAGLHEFGESDRRRALIAFSNAADFRSTTSFSDLAELAGRLGPAFVLVGTPVEVSEQVNVGAVLRDRGRDRPVGDTVFGTISGRVFPATLNRLARQTGGIAVNLGDGDPAALIADMFTWLRTRYVISYEPP